MVAAQPSAMATPSPEALDAFKYSDLQNLAKRLGLRANLRADKLLKSLKAHLEHKASKENESEDNSEIKINDLNESQSQDTQELSTAAKVPSPSDESQENENAVFSVKNGISGMPGNKNSKMPSERKNPLYIDKFSKHGKSKRTASTTPNFKKLHEAHFKEMESLDQYIERKKKRFEDYNSSNEVKKQPVAKGVVATPVSLRSRSIIGTPDSRLGSQGQHRATAGQSTSCMKGPVRCSVLSAAKMNVRFSAATKDNEHKRSLTKTPSRMSPHVTTSWSTPKSQTMLRTPKLQNTRGESTTVYAPFKFTAATLQTPTSHRKPVFDLQASLSQPLSYEPHKGKLKPWGISKENNSLNEHVNRVNFLKKTYKQHCLQSREEQRKKQEQERKEKKAKILGTRRGLTIAKN
ncbi:nucleolar and spindle-associated protein 1 isoform X2 [Erinaceus europaeus]|uniref:Nucleolar and spindle-associated protein 1 isoform X2 n=1 Tax=Erinaceus europaeus TaxID=9365 RepID=A0ABM3W396_ERIEU|nr:nucleolar and spindle-associated protein 1 isoform X2 [Erinaceus europaeus]